MAETLRLKVFRIDDPSRELELHNNRREALHDALDNVEGITVTDWGQTDDTEAHEWVEVQIAVATVVEVVVVPALAYLGEKLIDAAISEFVSEGIKVLLERLRPKQKANKIDDFNISVDGVVIRILPEGHSGSRPMVRVALPSGVTIDIPYDATQEEVSALRGRSS